MPEMVYMVQIRCYPKDAAKLDGVYNFLKTKLEEKVADDTLHAGVNLINKNAKEQLTPPVSSQEQV